MLLTVRARKVEELNSTVQLVALGRSMAHSTMCVLWSLDIGTVMHGVGTQVVDVGDTEGSVLVTVGGTLYAVGSS